MIAVLVEIIGIEMLVVIPAETGLGREDMMAESLCGKDMRRVGGQQ